MKTKLQSREEYEKVMVEISTLLSNSTANGGFDFLSSKEATRLKQLSILAEKFEDSIPLMPIKKPSTISEMLRFKMFELNIKQKQLAKMLEISESRVSELLSGKRKLTFELAKKLYFKLNIDADFILRAS